MDLLQSLIGDMGIDLRRGDGRMAEHRLDGADISAIPEEVGGEAVAQRMRMNVFHESGFLGIVFDQSCDGTGCEAECLARCILFIHEPFFGMRDKESGVNISSLFEIAANRLSGTGRQENDADF